MCKHNAVEQAAYLVTGDCPVCLRAELEVSVEENAKLVAENVRLHAELGEWQTENATLHAENQKLYMPSNDAVDRLDYSLRVIEDARDNLDDDQIGDLFDGDGAEQV